MGLDAMRFAGSKAGWGLRGRVCGLAGPERADACEGVCRPQDDEGVVVGEEEGEPLDRGVKGCEGGLMERVEGDRGVHKGRVGYDWFLSSIRWVYF